MEVDGINLAVGGGAVSAIAGIAGAWIKAKFGKTTVPQPLKTEIAPTPLPVEERDKFMTRGECKRLMCAHDTQIAELRSDVKTGNINILHKLEAMDRKSEERAIAAHNRIEPLVQKLANNIGQVELMKEVFIKSAIGGKK